MTRRLVVALGAAVLALGIAEIRASEAEPIDLGTAFGAAAYAADIEAQAYRVGADAAQAARIDPARAESIVAARYREALTLATDEAARGRIKAAFQRGYQEAVASAATDAAAPAQFCQGVLIERQSAHQLRPCPAIAIAPNYGALPKPSPAPGRGSCASRR